MSQHGRIIGREKSTAIIKRNSNGRIPAVLAVFGIMLGVTNIIEFIGLSIASPVPLIIMIVLLYTIDESILHSEIKSVRYIFLLLLCIAIIQTGLDFSDLSLFAPLLHIPDTVLWGILLIHIGILYRGNPFLIRNEVLGKLIEIVNCIAGILFLAAGLELMGAFLGLVPPMPVMNTIAVILGGMAGMSIAVLCSFSNRVFLKQLKRITQVKKRVNNYT